MTTWRLRAKSAANRSVLRPSMVKSSSSSMASDSWATRARGRYRAISALACSAFRASSAIRRRSASTRGRTPGRRIFSTTSVPSRRAARWTWAMEAAARGVTSKRPKTCSGGPPSAASTSGRRTSKSRVAPPLCSRSNSSIQSGGNRSERVDRIWPSLMKVGPSASSASRVRRDRGSPPASSPAPDPRPAPSSRRARTAPSPKRAAIPDISVRRFRSRAATAKVVNMAGQTSHDRRRSTSARPAVRDWFGRRNRDMHAA